MREKDPGVREGAFDFLREHADAYVDELIAEFTAERDEALRCWLLELLAEARSAKALDVFRGQLESPDESLQFWAVRGLEMLDSREADRVLEQARDDGWIA
ncbi:HEAT repeat domain-containing protein [Actinomadura latina]|uniref:HEAT repeat domain-containing protein n=1 Tax=Actinomadura latina TaxID=163603 RepID=A0A846YUI4_9ACTN|nr:HEAT repeat domain-containing protein [Actinomadura latina]NKZ02274.1 HEAT repeat domain-containing protein [Actinomadura latina]